MRALIDVVSVIERMEGDRQSYFVATLTYFYRNPDLQMGEYERVFPLKAAAVQWVEQFKGRSAMVHVNPKRPEESVLRSEEVERLTLHAAAEGEAALQLERFPVLSRTLVLLSTVAECVGLVGLIGCVAQLVVSLRHGGEAAPEWLAWTAGAMLVFALVAYFVVLLRAEKMGTYSHLSQNFQLWSPGWMRWAMSLSYIIIAMAWFISALLPELFRQLMAGSGALVPDLLFAMGFLTVTAFHAAILRTQQQARHAPQDTTAALGNENG